MLRACARGLQFFSPALEAGIRATHGSPCGTGSSFALGDVARKIDYKLIKESRISKDRIGINGEKCAFKIDTLVFVNESTYCLLNFLCLLPY